MGESLCNLWLFHFRQQKVFYGCNVHADGKFNNDRRQKFILNCGLNWMKLSVDASSFKTAVGSDCFFSGRNLKKLQKRFFPIKHFSKIFLHFCFLIKKVFAATREAIFRSGTAHICARLWLQQRVNITFNYENQFADRKKHFYL